MKLPSMPTRKPKAPSSGSSSKVQAPAFAQDLYKDMRDRRLIIPAIALLIAIIAVPVVLGSSSESAVTPPAPFSDPDAVAVEPAVLAVSEQGVRDFQTRLSELKQKNPFGGQFEPEPVKDEPLDDASETDPLPEAPGGNASNLPDTNGTGTEPVPPTTTDPPESFVLVPRVDAKTKIVGRDQEEIHENVESGDILPSKRAPVVLYLDNSNDSQRAVFLVSRDVENVNGEGTCKPKKSNCEFLTLEDGETAYLRYADGNRYALTVTNIFFARIPESEFNEQD